MYFIVTGCKLQADFLVVDDFFSDSFNLIPLVFCQYDMLVELQSKKVILGAFEEDCLMAEFHEVCTGIPTFCVTFLKTSEVEYWEPISVK